MSNATKDKKLVVMDELNRRQLKSALTTLKKARELLIKVGWGKGDETVYHYYDSSNKPPKLVGFCAIGALRKADGPGEHDAELLLAQTIDPETDFSQLIPHSYKVWQTIVYFNDETKRRKRDVLAKFDKTIKRIEERLAK